MIRNTGFLRLFTVLAVAIADIVCHMALPTQGHPIRDPVQNKYDFRESVLDLRILSVIRSTILIGASLSILLFSSYKNVVLRLASCVRYVVFIVAMLISDFALIKFLAVADTYEAPWYQVPRVTSTIGSTILFCITFVFAWEFGVCGIKATDLTGTSVHSETQENLLSEKNKTESSDDNEREIGFQEGQSLILRLVTYSRHEPWWFGIAFIAMIIRSVVGSVEPFYSGMAISGVIGGMPQVTLIDTLIVLAGIKFAWMVSVRIENLSGSYAQNKLNLRMRNELFTAIVNQEIGFFDSQKTGDITSRLTADVQTMADALANNMNQLISSIIQLTGKLIVMFQLSWRLSLQSLIVIPVLMVIGKLFGNYQKKLGKECQDTLARANEVADEVIGNVRTVRSFGTEKRESQRYRSKLETILNVNVKQALAELCFGVNNEILGTGAFLFIMWYGGHLVSIGKMESKHFFAFFIYHRHIDGTLHHLSRMYAQMMKATGASAKVFELIDRKPKLMNDGEKTSSKLNGSIEFKNVSLAYPTRPDMPVLNDISFKVAPGEIVALVGPSGGGKSSCFSLLQHLYEPTSGRILIDGVQVSSYDHEFYHRMVSIVSQEPVLFGCSVADNITYGLDEDEYTRDDVIDMAKMANAHEFIHELKEKYETQTGEKGIQLSGGQKQRVAIARSLIRKPKILLLDEATSALDADSEFKVQEAIYNNLKGHTVLLIAHRLSTVRKASRILVINKGKVVQQGSHSQLLEVDGVYRNLVQKQLIGSTTNQEVNDRELRTNGL